MFREHARTQDFGCHGRTNYQWYRNLADHHPSVPVDTFDHHAASTFIIVFGAAIPEAFRRLPFFCIAASVNNTFPVPQPPSWPGDLLPDYVSENVLDIVVILRDRDVDFPFSTMTTAFF